MADLCEVCGVPQTDSPNHVCCRTFTLTDEDLRGYQLPQAELIERLAANWHEVPHRNSYMMEVTAKRIQAALAHSGLKLAPL